MNSSCPFVYGLVDPADVSHVRYVGMATGASRPYAHAKEARSPKTRPSHKINWIRLIQSEGREPSVLVLEELPEGASRSFVGQIETMYIDSLKRIGHRLTNITSGGDGGDTGPASLETRAKIGAAVRRRYEDPCEREKMSTVVRARSTPEFLAKLSASHVGHEVSVETRARLSQAMNSSDVREKISLAVKSSQTPEVLAKISAALTGHSVTDETRQKIKAALAGRIVPPEQIYIRSEENKAKISASLMGHGVSDESRERMSEAQKKRFQSPVEREKRSVSAKAGVTLETRLKISEAGKGRTASLETREKMRQSHLAFRARQRVEAERAQ